MKQIRFGKGIRIGKKFIKRDIRHSHCYTEEEDKIIKENYLFKSDLMVGNMIGRSSSAITQRRYNLNLLRTRKSGFKTFIKHALRESEIIRKQWTIIQDMKALIIICELESNTFKRNKYKEELRKLSAC